MLQTVIDRLEFDHSELDIQNPLENLETNSSMISVSRFNRESMEDKLKVWLIKFNDNFMKKHLIYQRKIRNIEKKGKDRGGDSDEFSSGDTLEHSIKGKTSYEDENEDLSCHDTENHDLTIPEVRIKTSELSEMKQGITPQKIYEAERTEDSDKLKPSRVQQTPPKVINTGDSYTEADEVSPPTSENKINQQEQLELSDSRSKDQGE